MTRSTLWVVLLGFLVATAKAEPLEVNAYQTIENGKQLMLVPMKTYRRLSKPPAVPDEFGPIQDVPDVAVRSALSGKISNRRAEVTLSVTYDLGSRGPRHVPLIEGFDGLVVTSFSGPGELCALPAAEGGSSGCSLITSATGPATIQLGLLVPAVRTGQIWSVDLPLVGAPQQTAEVRLAGEGEVTVSAEGAIVVRSAMDGRDTVTRLVGRGGKSMRLKWETPIVLPVVRPGPEVPPVTIEQETEPELTVLVSTLVNVGPTYLKARSDVAVQVRRNPVKELTLAASAAQSLVNIEGPQVHEWESTVRGDVQYARIVLKSPVQDKVDLQVEYELHPAEPGGATRDRSSGADGSAKEESGARMLSFLPVFVPEAYQEEHYLGLTRPPNLHLAPRVKEPWRDKEQARLDESVKNLKDQNLARLVHCQRFPRARKEDPLAPVDIGVKKLADVQLLQATIDVANAYVSITEDGNALGRVTYSVQNNSQQFLTLMPPSRSRPLTVYVAGKAVPAASDASKRWLVPLGKSIRTATGAAPFEVEVTYLQELAKLEADTPLRLDLPSPDLGISTLRWKVDLPKEWALHVLSANVKRDDVARLVEFASQGQADSARAPAALFDEATLPLRIELPPQRDTSHFSADLIDKDSEARFVSFVVRRSVPAATRRAAAFLVGVVVFYIILRRRPEGRARATATLVSLIGTGILMAVFGWAYTNLGLGLHLALGLFMGTVVFGLSRLAVCVTLPAE